MSVTTKSMVLLAAMGLAACDSSNSNSSNVVEPEAPELVEPAIAGLTREKAIADFTAGTAVAALAKDVRDARTELADASADLVTASGLRTQMVAILNKETLVANLSGTDRTTLQGLIVKLNEIKTFGGYAVSFETTDVVTSAAAIVSLDAEIETLAGVVNTASGSLTTKLQQLTVSGTANADFDTPNGSIELADGTVLQTTGIAIYTRVDDTAKADTILTPTATVIVAYETDAKGTPTNVRFIEAGGIDYDRAPVGTAFAESNDSKSFAYLHVEGEDAMRVLLNGTADLLLNFNQQTGSLVISANNTDSKYESRSMLTFDRLTGKFTSTSGDFSVTTDDQLIAGSNVNVEGGLRGLAEAFSGTFIITDSRVNGGGGFAGTVDTK